VVFSNRSLRDRASIIFLALSSVGLFVLVVLLDSNYGLEAINTGLSVATNLILVSATLTTAYIAWKKLEREYEPQVEVENSIAKLEDEEWHNVLKIKNKGKTDIHIDTVTTHFVIEDKEEFFYIKGSNIRKTDKKDITVPSRDSKTIKFPEDWKAFGCTIVEFDTDYISGRKEFGGEVAIAPSELNNFTKMWDSVQEFFDLDQTEEIRWTVLNKEFINALNPDDRNNPGQKIRREMKETTEERRNYLRKEENSLEPDLVTGRKEIELEVCSQEIIEERGFMEDFMTERFLKLNT
jgi:hypothetical protein